MRNLTRIPKVLSPLHVGPRVGRILRGAWNRLLSAFKSSLTVGHQFVDYFLCAVYVYRVPLLVSFFAFLVMSQPGQIQELYILTLTDGVRGWGLITFVILLTFVLSFALLILADVSSRYFPRSRDTRGYRAADLSAKIVCALLPIMGVQLGMYMSTAERFNANFIKFYDVYQNLLQKHPDERELAVFAPALLDWQQFPGFVHHQLQFASALGALMVLFFVTPYSRRGARSFFERFVGPDIPLMASPVYRAVLILTVLLVLIFLSPNIWQLPEFVVEAPRIVGGLSVVLLFLFCFAWHLSSLSEMGDRTGYPALILVAGSALVFSYFDLNDNHGIRSRLLHPRKWETSLLDPRLNDPSFGMTPALNRINRAVEGGKYHYELDSPPTLPSLGSAFVAWFNARPNKIRARFSNTPYPIYIVAAEGGGIYAASQTAIFLARLLDRCPALTHHIFAISAVSGGSLGASLIPALIKRKQQDLGVEKAADYFASCPGKLLNGERFFESAAVGLLSEDHLSPSIGVGLFPDFLQRFLPIPIGTVDRARALERSIEQSWSKHFPGTRNPFGENFREHWSPSGTTPMLLLNTTVVETGTQAILAPVEASDHAEYVFGDTLFSRISARYDIPLSTAVGLSARFTAVAPAGHHIDKDGPNKSVFHRSERLVDGGYIDNSGVETATSAWQSIVSMLGSGEASQQLELISSEFKFEFRMIIIGSPGRGYFAPHGLNELASPVAAMYNGRGQRAERAIRNVNAEPPVSLAWDYFTPPLGWVISYHTIEIIGAHIGTAERCSGPATYDPTEASLEHRASLLPADQDSWAADTPVVNFLRFWHQLRTNHCTACSMIRRAQGKVAEAQPASSGGFTPYGWYPYADSCDERSSDGVEPSKQTHQ